jgi:acyl carrier protein
MDDREARLLETFRRVAPVWASTGAVPIDEPIGIRGLGLDSIAVIDLLDACEREFGVKLPDAVLSGPPLTLARLLDAISRAETRR